MYLPKLVMDRKSIRFINTDGDVETPLQLSQIATITTIGM